MTIRIDRAMLDALVDSARGAARRRQHRNLHQDAAEPVQRLLIAIEPDSYVVPHRHSAPGKRETLTLLRGRLGLILFDDGGRVQETCLFEAAGEALGVELAAGVYHSVVALETGTVIFEVKAGPYNPVLDVERAAWAPAESAPAARDYLAGLHALFAANQA